MSVDEWKFVAFDPEGQCQKIGLALPVSEGPGVTVSVDPVTGQKTYTVNQPVYTVVEW